MLLANAKVKSYEPELELDGQFIPIYANTPTEGNKERMINPLEAFVVTLKKGVDPKAKLRFPTTVLNSTSSNRSSTSMLRNNSEEVTKEPVSYLSLTLQSLLGKDRTIVAYGYKYGSVDKLLMSTKSSYPWIAIIDPEDGHYKDLFADNAAMDRYKLATQVAEPLDVTLSLSGNALGNVTSARLIDHKSGLEHDLTGGKSCQIKLFPDDSEGRLELQVEGDFTAVAPAEKPSATLQAQYKQGRLTIRTSEPMSSVRLVQVDGVTLYWQQLPELTEYSEQLYLSTGSYIVETVSTEGTTRRVKLLVQ